MRRAIAFLLGLCMLLALAPVTAEEAGDCSGSWYFVYGSVTIGEMALNADGTYRMALYSRDAADEGTWTGENGTVTLASRAGDRTTYAYDGTRLIPDDYEITFVIRREPGRVTDSQLNEYAQNRTLPEGITEEEMQEIILEAYSVAEANAREANPFGDFTGVWVNDGNGYLTIWGRNIAAAFPNGVELVTGFYGNPGEWTLEGNALINTDGTILVMKNDGSLLCSEDSGTYAFTRVFSPSEVSAGPDAEAFAGDWQGTGALITDDSGVKIFTPVTGYDVKIDGEQIYTLFDGETGAYPYEIIPESGRLVYTPDGGAANELVLYQDGTLRWALADNITLVFRRAETARAAADTAPEEEDTGSGILDAETFEAVSLPYSRGFAIPAVTSWGTPERTEDKANSTISFRYVTEAFVCEENCSFVELDSFPDADAYLKQIRANLMSKGTYRELAEKTTEINGNPAYIMCFRADSAGEAAETAGFIYIIRENTALVMSVLFADSRENPSRITLKDLETIVEQVAFDPEKAPIRKADGELSITSKGSPKAAVAGRSVTFTAAFANPAAVKREKADAVTWSVTAPETGTIPEGITLSDRGQLKIGRELTAPVKLVVTVSSEKFGTEASYPITAVPAVRKLSAEPGSIVLYAGSEDSAPVRVSADPEGVPYGLEWTIRPDTVAEVIPGEDGTAVLKALAAGKATLTVKEPGGKTDTVRVSVLQPVESVELKAAGKAVPGGTVTITATIQPKNAGDKKTEWSLDVGEDIATVDGRGRVRINRNAPAGTVITVTCTATGAKEPVAQTIQIEVAER